MKKLFRFYAICWAIALAVFHLIVFVIADNTVGLSNFGFSFWVAYAFIVLAFILNLGCSYAFFKEENKNKTFLKLPVIIYAYAALIISLIVGIIAMTVEAIPYWVGMIVNFLIFAFYAIAITKAVAAASVVSDVDKKVKVQTSFIKLLTADADALRSRAKTDEAKELTRKVYEAIRYSDPMSVPELMGVEAQIQNEFSAFAAAVKSEDDALAATNAETLINLIGDRNKKCKVLK